jgi:hypothetical protein
LTELTVSHEPTIDIQVLPAPEPWKAWLFPLPAFPLPDEHVEAYRAAMLHFAERIAAPHNWNEALALQLWKMSGKHGGDVLQQHMDQWPSDLGFGVWPNRPAPIGWTDEGIQDAAAAVYRGDEPTLPMHRMLLFKMEDRESYRNALKQMSGFGMAIQFFSSNPIADLKQRGRDEFLPCITDPRFRSGRIYLPVLDSESMRAAKDAAELERWLCGVDMYIRESAEDRGLLVIARRPSDRVNETLNELAERIVANRGGPLKTA